MRTLSIITVSYNSATTIETALRSAVESAIEAGLVADIIVVDNASVDGSVPLVRSLLPSARLIENPDNVGFAKANNQAFAVAEGDLWLLVNPDAAVDRGAVAALVRELDAKPRTAAAAPSIDSYASGSAESAGMRPSVRSALGHFLFVNRLLPGDRGGAWRGFQIRRRRGSAPRLVEWASGALLLLRPAALREVGGFDASWFLYGDDVDLGTRLTDAGWNLTLVPAASTTHLIAGSQGGVTARWFDAIHQLYAREASRGALALFDLVAFAGLAIRAVSLSTARSTEGRLRAKRMRVSAGRAAALFARTVVRGN